MRDLRDRIAEIIRECVRDSLYDKDTSDIKADKILNLKVRVKCPLCEGGFTADHHRCIMCESGYIKESLKEMVNRA